MGDIAQEVQKVPGPECECGCHITSPFTSDDNKSRPEGFVCTECPCLANQIVEEWIHDGQE